MIKTIKLASFELRRFKGPLPIIALLFLLLLPTLFGALYLWSNWDPYGKLDQLPVAVVNLDQPVEVNGKTVDAGDRMVTELQADPIFKWQFVSEDQAAAGLADGTYDLTVIIPEDFSANLVSGQGDDPQRAVVTLHRDDANGYAIGLLTASVQTQLEAAIDRAAIGAYFETVFANLDTIKTDVTNAATGATQLAAGADTITKGATDLSTGITTAKDGSAQLVTGLADAKTGSSALVTGSADAKAGSASLLTGLTTLDTGAQTLQPAAQEVADGNAQLASEVVPLLGALGGAVPAIQTAGETVSSEVSNVSTAAETMAGDLSTASTALQALAQEAAAKGVDQSLITDAIDGMNAAITSNNAVGSALGRASLAADGVTNAVDTLTNAGAGDLSTASSNITALATGSAQVATGVDQLATGISTASSSASTLDSGLVDLNTGATALDTGIGTLQLGAQQLDDGLGTLQTGSTTLVDGVTGLDTGANQLATELTDSAARIPTLAPDQQGDAQQVLSSPADVKVAIDNPAVVYGRGLAPFFFAIAIWVFAIAVFLVMRPINGRALAGRTSTARITLAGWFPVLGIAVLGSMVLLGVVWLGLGLDPVNIGGSIGVVVLAAACFTAIAHLLRTWLGVAGSAITLVLLMVQLTSAGGLYPVETMPAPFRAVHNFIPMTYLVDALRISFTGGPIDHLWRDIGVLAGFTVVAVGLCMWVVHRRRTFRLQDLHPVLV
ncbi:MAG: YhgE/Pip domain-containing protein [Nakamurella sp.]